MFFSCGLGDGVHGAGASGKCIGQSSSGRGESKSRCSKLPAQASLLVRYELKLKRSFAVEQIELSSNSEVGVGPDDKTQSVGSISAMRESQAAYVHAHARPHARTHARTYRRLDHTPFCDPW